MVFISSDCVHPDPKTLEEKDSNAGLMVWDDLKPEEIKERMLSPKCTDEPGASSELGLEVLDDAIGPVVQSVTVLPAQPTTVRIAIYMFVYSVLE